MRDLWVDPFSGLSGDLWVGAFLALGVPEADLAAVLRRLPFDDLALEVKTVLRCGVEATKASVVIGGRVDTGATPHLAEGPLKGIRKRVKVGGHDHVHGLSWREVDEVLARHLDPKVAALAREAFRRLGESEARVHGMPLEQVHFHEVGVKDSIADVALAAAGYVLLGEPRVHIGPIATGKGTWKMAHGQYPIPGPATTYLLTGFELKEGVAPVDRELTTPTGAALAVALATTKRAPARFIPERAAFAAGGWDFPTTPNVLRLQLGTVPEGDAELLQLETNVDDATPQQVAHAQARLMEAGALDAWVTAATFKKGRSGWVVGVILEPAKLEPLSEILVSELPTLGLRCWPLQRLEAQRSFRASAVEGVDLKEGRWPNTTVQQPEYDHAAKVAKATGESLRAVQAKAKGE
jgi:uncharacterized protein (TIGR00299 family) protein